MSAIDRILVLMFKLAMTVLCCVIATSAFWEYFLNHQKIMMFVGLWWVVLAIFWIVQTNGRDE